MCSSRSAIKSQVLADFVADWTEAMEKANLQESEYWTMHFDGSKMKKGLGAGVVLKSPKGDTLSYVLQIHFNATNNVAEYEALLHGMHIAKDLGVKFLLCYGDSDLVQHQVDQTWDAKAQSWPNIAEPSTNSPYVSWDLKSNTSTERKTGRLML